MSPCLAEAMLGVLAILCEECSCCPRRFSTSGGLMDLGVVVPLVTLVRVLCLGVVHVGHLVCLAWGTVVAVLFQQFCVLWLKGATNLRLAPSLTSSRALTPFLANRHFLTCKLMQR